MRHFYALIAVLIATSLCIGQTTYFPPVTGEWEALDFNQSNIDENLVPELYDFLDSTDSKSMMLLIDGKIALEYYSDDHNETQPWYWASAGKTLTAALVGVAQGEGLLNIQDKTSSFLGDWTTCPDEEITIYHQLTMTSGLDYTVDQLDCTDPECLQCLNNPGEEWYYHNAPYTLLEEVVATASGRSYNNYTRDALTSKIGMTGTWLSLGFNNVFWSNTRSFARFGLLLLNEGNWAGDQLIPQSYHKEMTSSSQDINLAYGYLTWLNGKESYRLPSSTIDFQGSFSQDIPSDAYMGIGKNSQICMVIPSKNMVLIRMGNDPDISPVPTYYVNELWNRVNAIFKTSSTHNHTISSAIRIYPNPTTNRLIIQGIKDDYDVKIIDMNGKILQHINDQSTIDVSMLSMGIYQVVIKTQSSTVTRRFVKGK